MRRSRGWIQGGIGVMLAASSIGVTFVDGYDVTATSAVESQLTAQQAAGAASEYLTQSAAALGVQVPPDVLTVTAVPAGHADIAEPLSAGRPDAIELEALAGRTWWVVRAQGVFVPRSSPAFIETRIGQTGYLIVDGDTGQIWGMGTP